MFHINRLFIIGKYSSISILFSILITIRIFNKLDNESPPLYMWNESYSNFNANELNRTEDRELYLKNKISFYYNIRANFLLKHHVIYNESNLTTFQDKLNYLVIHESPQYKSFMVDKIKLRDYSKKKLGKDICVPLFKTYDDVNQIKLEELPDKFVMKYNHGSGMNIICKDKKTLNIQILKHNLNKWKNMNYGLWSTEFQYIYVKRRILVEKFLSENLIIYKVFCFNGEPKFIQTEKKINITNHTFAHNYYDLDWNLTELETKNKFKKRHPDIIIEKPKNLKLMIKYAKLLSQEFVFVRVDLYEFNNKVYLGEMTFTPCNSFHRFKNATHNLIVGDMVDVGKIKKYLFNT